MLKEKKHHVLSLLWCFNDLICKKSITVFLQGLRQLYKPLEADQKDLFPVLRT